MATADLKLIYGSGGGGVIIPKAGQTYDGGFGIGGVTVANADLSAGATVVSLSGTYALNTMYLDVDASGVSTCSIILTIDGKVVLNTTISLSSSPPNYQRPIWGNGTSGVSFQQPAPLLVRSSLTLFLQRSSSDPIGVRYNAVSIE